MPSAKTPMDWSQYDDDTDDFIDTLLDFSGDVVGCLLCVTGEPWR